MKGILNEWYNLKIELFDVKNGYTKIPIPLYINIADQFKTIDEFNECVSHLKSPEYKECYRLFNQIESAQDDYNQNVNSLFLEYKTKILELIQKVENFKLVDEEYFFLHFF